MCRWIKTDLVRKEHGWSTEEIEKKMGKGASLTADGAVQSIVKACSHDDDIHNGDYILRERALKLPTAPGMDDASIQDELWEKTKKMIKWK